MTLSNPSSQSRFHAQLWADVGGTFTDCFIVVGNERRSLKVLSSGIVRAQWIGFSETGILNTKIPHRVPENFWVGATLRLVQDGESVFESRISYNDTDGHFQLETAFDAKKNNRSPNVIELDAGLEAPVIAAHLLLKIPISSPLPPIDIRLGTTRGTNALLTRRGTSVGFITTLGFGDCLLIGEQNRPDLFALEIEKPEPLTRHVIEVDERLTASGEVLRPIDLNGLHEKLQLWKQANVQSIAICLLHAHVNDLHERIVADLASEFGFENISLSSQLAPMIKLVSRAETTVLDAYLNPILTRYVSRLNQQFNRGESDRVQTTRTNSRLRLMTSGGNLVETNAFRGADSILSGPAGGVVALGKIADVYLSDHAIIEGAIGLDMGGTSTDVCRYAGKIPRDYESRKAGVRVLSPMMSIHTVAAGGGSICDVVDGRMIVGPQSAGADPGPACYGRGGPLTVTDLNVILGRLPKDCFPFPLDVDAARKKLAEINEKLGASAFESEDEAAEGFLTIAITHMAEAVRTVSISQGSDPRNFALVGFGGAAGGHVCAIANAIGMTRVIDHREASLLSALGIGLADIGRIRTRGVYQMLDTFDADSWNSIVTDICDETSKLLDQETRTIAPGPSAQDLKSEADLRYQGTEATLSLDALPLDTLAQRFHEAHRVSFGYEQLNRRIEVAAIRCEATVASSANLEAETPHTSISSRGVVEPTQITNVYLEGKRQQVPLIRRSEVAPNATLAGPAIVFDANSTLVIEPGWIATMNPHGSFDLNHRMEAKTPSTTTEAQVDPVTIEVVARRMQGIADSMGELLRRTAASVNIRQRLDFSCAIFTSSGELIANAPHVPVHLGAMGHTVRHIRRTYPSMSAGDVYVSNNPYAGGSHLPDVTVVTPVFSGNESRSQGCPDFFVASRAHHAEIGGKTPGSMPPDAHRLGEEGVVIDTFALQRDGIDCTDKLRDLFNQGPFPSRDPDTNIADIAAQRAAGMLGVTYLQQLIASMGMSNLDRCIHALFDLADGMVSNWIRTLAHEPMLFEDSLDDGTRIKLQLRPQGDRLTIDFAGTSDVHPACFNATPAIVTAATIYVLRCVIGGTVPMNDGLLRSIDLQIPHGLLNPLQGSSPSDSPAVVAGNVETSMRIVDCLLGALGLVAASQGTMNNVLIGNESFGYYETIGGGAGAGPNRDGASGVHTHMTNTRITDPEIYESRYPIRLWKFQIRQGSGGKGRRSGGEGLIREIEFLQALSLAMITNRRGTYRPWGSRGGGDAMPGENLLIDANGECVSLPAAFAMKVNAGQRLVIKTPGGGGYENAS